MQSISLCMIVKNEAEVLGRCLDSVKDVVDEIVIVDTGSTDATKQIARQYTERVYDFTWIDDFAAARNAAFDKARCDYILWLDADDVVLPPDRKALARLKRELTGQEDVVMMNYHIAVDENGRPGMRYWRERLIKNHRGFRWQGAIHEAITPSGRVVYRDIAITHRKERVTDPDRNLRIFEGIRKRGGQLNPREQYYYGRELMDHQRYAEAMEQLKAYLEGGAGYVEDEIGACRLLAGCYEHYGKTDLAQRMLLRTFLYAPPRAEVCCQLGKNWLDQGQLEMAVFWYELAIACPRVSGGGFDTPDCHDYIPYLQLCVCHDRLGHRQEAERYNELAAAIRPESTSVAYNRAYFEQCRKSPCARERTNPTPDA